MKKRSIGGVLLFGSLVFSVCAPLFSQDIIVDTAGHKNFFEMAFEDLLNVRVITPTQSLVASRSAPATVMVITGEQIKLRGYRNLGEILNDMPDFKVNDKSDPQFFNAISVRGIFRQDRFVILLDGVRISSPTNEPLPLLENFPIYLAKQIEVVYGPGSALYGADAMAGVINIITDKGSATPRLDVTSMAGTQGYSNHTVYFNKSLRNGFQLTTGGQYSYDQQPDFSKVYPAEYDMTGQRERIFQTSYGSVTPSGPIDPAYEAPIKAYNFYTSLDKDGFSVKVIHHYAQVPTSTTFTPNNAVYNKNVFYGQGVTTASASYSTLVGRLKTTTSVVGSFYRVNPRSNFRNVYGGMELGYKYSTGSMIKIEEQVSMAVANKVSIAGGVTYELFQSIPKTPELQSPVSEKGAAEGILLNTATPAHPAGIEAKFFPLTYGNFGSYIQCIYAPEEVLSFTLGVRYDYNSRFGSTVNPRIGAVYTPATNTTIKVLYGTAYWAPSPLVSFESYGAFYSADGGQTYTSSFWHLPNPGLKPMTSQNAEISITQKVSSFLNATVTGYYTKIHDVIRNLPDNGNTNLYNDRFLNWPVGYIEVPFNMGDQSTYGGSVVVNSTFAIGKNRFNPYASASYVDGRVLEYVSWEKTKEVEIGMISPWQFRLGMDGRMRAFNFSVRSIHVGDQRLTGLAEGEDPERRQTIAGYSLLNASIGYTIRNKVTFFSNVQNALNKAYRNPLAMDLTDPNPVTFAGSLQDPRRIMLGIRVSLD